MTALLIIAAYVAITALIIGWFVIGAIYDDDQSDCLPFVPHREESE